MQYGVERMTPKRGADWPVGEDLRALFGELAELIDEIGEEVSAAVPPRPAARRTVPPGEGQGTVTASPAPPTPRPVASTPGGGEGRAETLTAAEGEGGVRGGAGGTVLTLDGIPLDDPTDLDVVAVLCPAPSLEAQPHGVPWSPEAAARPLPPLGPPQEQPPERPSRAMLWVIAVAAVAAGVAALIRSNDWVRTGGPEHPVSPPPITVTDLRATAAATVAQGPRAPTQTTFAADVRQIVLDAGISGAEPGDQLEWTVSLRSSGYGPAKVVADVVEPVLESAPGHVEHVVTAPSPGFGVGTYDVTVLSGQRVLATSQFRVVGAGAP